MVVSGDVEGGLCVWKRGEEDAVIYRAPKRGLPMGFAAVTSVAVAGGAVIVREGRAGFLVLDAATLGVIAKLPHKDAETVLARGDVVITTGGKLIQAFRAGTWQVIASRDRLGAGTRGYMGQGGERDLVPRRRRVLRPPQRRRFQDARGSPLL